MHVLLEHSMKNRLAARGVTVPELRVVSSAADAVAAAHELGGAVVVKALIGVGDRGRKNLVRSVGTPEETGRATEQMLGAVCDGQVVERVLVERMASPGPEHFIGYGFDYCAASTVFLHGPGGSGVEERGTLRRVPFRLSDGPPLGAHLDVPALVPTAEALFEEFSSLGARSVELNPVRLTAEGPVVLDAKTVLDTFTPLPDGAHEIRVMASETAATQALRVRDVEIGGTSALRYEELGGDIGLVMWGGGASLVILDALLRLGLQPMNYADVSAGAGILERQTLIADTVLSERPRGVLMATSAMGTSIASTAQIFRDALVRQRYEDGRTPVVVRLNGPDEPRARELLDLPNVHFRGGSTTLEEAVDLLAELIGHFRAGT
jgi:succinyl-CoA synthetase beta subunit